MPFATTAARLAVLAAALGAAFLSWEDDAPKRKKKKNARKPAQIRRRVIDKSSVDMEKSMPTSRAFVSFDYDHDESLKMLLVGQAKNSDTPFNLADWSIKEEINGNWKEKARKRIKAVDVVIVICGQYTHTATGVSAEIKIAQEEGVPYFLLSGYSDKTCTRPTAAVASDKIYKWTWDNLKALISGAR